MKKASGRLARKLQRGASLVNAGLSTAVQTVLGAATADRCDSFEKCCSDAPCPTEQQCNNVGSLRFRCCAQTACVGNRDAQALEKLLGWFSEERPRKAWFPPPVIAFQNSRCNLRARQMFRPFFLYAAVVLQTGCHIFWEWLAKCVGWNSVEFWESRDQQKSCGRELFVAACDSCCFATRENSLLDSQRWQFLTSDSRIKAYMSLQCQRNEAHVCKRSDERKRLYPKARTRRLVNGFVHDLRAPQLHMFCQKLTVCCPHLPLCLLPLLPKKPKRGFHQPSANVFIVFTCRVVTCRR